MKDFRIKVCGMRDAANIAAVATLPIDYMGFIFFEKSRRFVAQKIDFQNAAIRKVGVFVNADLDFVLSKVIENQLDAVQLHGKETPQYLSQLKIKNDELEIWKAFSVDADFDFAETEAYRGLATKFLFDTKSPQHGGVGVKFDWAILDKYRGETHFILAGGISETDAEAILNLKTKLPTLWGVDLNSRFEIEPASKDIEKLKRFINDIG